MYGNYDVCVCFMGKFDLAIYACVYGLLCYMYKCGLMRACFST